MNVAGKRPHFLPLLYRGGNLIEINFRRRVGCVVLAKNNSEIPDRKRLHLVRNASADINSRDRPVEFGKDDRFEIIEPVLDELGGVFSALLALKHYADETPPVSRC